MLALKSTNTQHTTKANTKRLFKKQFNTHKHQIQKGIKKMDILKKLNDNNGLTLDLNGEPLKADKGYLVSLKDFESILDYSQIDNNTLHSLIQKRIKESPNNAYIGLWKNKAKLYLDYSVLINDKEKATKFAKQNEQLAIFDLENKKEIFIK